MLTPAQLQAIDQHLRKENWLLNEDLLTELTDHYVVGINERLTQGVTFNIALREIHRNFGGRQGLLKMEEEKSRNRSPIIARELRQLIGSYFQPPRLSLTILLLGFAYWITIEGFVSEWTIWINECLLLIVTLPLLILSFRNGYLYVAGKIQSMKSVSLMFYRYILAVNLLNIINFFGGNTAISHFEAYSVANQTFIAYIYLLVWMIIVDFVIVQPHRIRAFSN